MKFKANNGKVYTNRIGMFISNIGYHFTKKDDDDELMDFAQFDEDDFAEAFPDDEDDESGPEWGNVWGGTDYSNIDINVTPTDYENTIMVSTQPRRFRHDGEPLFTAYKVTPNENMSEKDDSSDTLDEEKKPTRRPYELTEEEKKAWVPTNSLLPPQQYFDTVIRWACDKMNVNTPLSRDVLYNLNIMVEINGVKMNAAKAMEYVELNDKLINEILDEETDEDKYTGPFKGDDDDGHITCSFVVPDKPLTVKQTDREKTQVPPELSRDNIYPAGNETMPKGDNVWNIITATKRFPDGFPNEAEPL